MLQNDEYIEFANENTVEVLSLGSIDDGIAKNDRRAETYDAKDEAGNPVKYLKEFAGMTVEQVKALNGSPAGQYNKTGKVPYVAIVDPFTLKEIKSQPGGFAAGGLIKAVTEATAQLNKEHGPSLKRSVLSRYEAGEKDVQATLGTGGAAKALEALKKLQASIAKAPQALHDRAKKLEETVLDAAKAQLDEADTQIGVGDLKAAAAIVKPLASVLKGTSLEARVKELMEKMKAAQAPAEGGK